MSTHKNLGDEKKQLLSHLLVSVKNCQSRFGSRTELATEDDKLISHLCSAFEAVFLHGIKKPSSQTSKGIWQMTENFVPGLRYSEVSSFWHLIKSFLSKHEAERFLLLHNVRTDVGRGRAWLRAALNEHSLERYIHVILSFNTLSNFYEQSSFLLDVELSSILPQTAAGLGSILFALIVDNPVLDKVNSETMASLDDDPIASSAPELTEVGNEAGAVNISSKDLGADHLGTKGKKGKKKKKVPTDYVSFDETDCPSPSCINSPTDKHAPTSPLPQGQGQRGDTPLDATSNNTVPIPVMIMSLPQDIAVVGLDKPTNTYSTSLKSSDNLSIYSDTSDRFDIENLSLSKILPCDRLKPVGSSEDVNSSLNLTGDPERSQGLIPVPSYNTNGDDDGSNDFDPEKVSSASGSTSGIIFPNDPTKPINRQKESPEDQSQGSETDERIRKLKLVLDHEVEIVAKLTAQLADERRQYNDQSKMLEIKVETLTKENQLLRHQLKKYIGAVQLLKERVSGGVRRISLSIEQDEVDALENTVADEHSTEAAEYERKLIQVAEMHGELMEFNAYLQAVLQRKDQALRNLRMELEDLRGPLGELDDDDDASMDLSFAEIGSGQRHFPFQRQSTINERILINTWIPSAFLTGATNDLHHVYQVFLRIKDTEWNVYRRYSQFYNFHRELKKKDPIVDSFYFPPKKHIGNKDTKFVDERRRKLQEYLRKVINHILQTNSVLAAHPDKNLLISILPFFGEVTQPPKPKRSRSRGRNLFFRQTESAAEQQFLQESGHAQYTGL